MNNHVDSDTSLTWGRIIEVEKKNTARKPIIELARCDGGKIQGRIRRNPAQITGRAFLPVSGAQATFLWFVIARYKKSLLAPSLFIERQCWGDAKRNNLRYHARIDRTFRVLKDKLRALGHDDLLFYLDSSGRGSEKKFGLVRPHPRQVRGEYTIYVKDGEIFTPQIIRFRNEIRWLGLGVKSDKAKKKVPVAPRQKSLRSFLFGAAGEIELYGGKNTLSPSGVVGGCLHPPRIVTDPPGVICPVALRLDDAAFLCVVLLSDGCWATRQAIIDACWSELSERGQSKRFMDCIHSLSSKFNSPRWGRMFGVVTQKNQVVSVFLKISH